VIIAPGEKVFGALLAIAGAAIILTGQWATTDDMIADLIAGLLMLGLRRLMGTKRFLKSRDERKRVEMRFAHLKIHHGFERMRLRGLSGASDEFHLAAIVQNLKTLALRSIGPPVTPQFAPAA
jgi:hypothetical protein